MSAIVNVKWSRDGDISISVPKHVRKYIQLTRDVCDMIARNTINKESKARLVADAIKDVLERDLDHDT